MEYVPLRQLITPRLILRKLTMADAPAYYERLAGSAAVTEYMCWVPHRDLKESIASIQKTLSRYETGNCYRWAVALKETGELIGIIDLLNFDEQANTCGFAYMLGEAFWGQGFGTEALIAVIDFGFSQVKLDAIIADHMAENTASGNVMQKAGMRFQKTIPQKYEKNGRWYDAMQYCITRSDWLQNR